MFGANSNSNNLFITNGLYTSSAIDFGKPHWFRFNVASPMITALPE